MWGTVARKTDAMPENRRRRNPARAWTAQQGVDEISEKIDRMFKKSLRK